MKTYCTQNNGDCATCSLVNYGRDCRNIPMSLFATRQTLADDESNLYSPEFFPGTPDWNTHNSALQALLAFDEDHPEIKDELKAQRNSKDSEIAEKADWI